jgi:4-diphosphocytidyl-2-C-methyl-D-erythritol kinase
MIVFPNAKINLGLNVVEKRKDNFHNIISCFYPVPWMDILEIVESDKLQFHSSGIPIPGKPDENLCVKAYQLLKKDFGLPPVQIHLHKIIPIGAGLGGGSSDAAFTLKCINHLFELFLDNSILEHYARELGSDCAFFIENVARLAVEKGDQFEEIEIDLSKKWIVLVSPSIHIATSEAYSGVTPQIPEISLKEIIQSRPISDWKADLVNDFENSVFAKYGEIAAIKNQLYESGAVYASMSGSGSTVYGIFDKEPFFDDTFPVQYQIFKKLLD